jgi:hypothetical protein
LLKIYEYFGGELVYFPIENLQHAARTDLVFKRIAEAERNSFG